MGTISRLSKKCELCKDNGTCQEKRMEACAYIPEIPKLTQGDFAIPKISLIAGNIAQEIVINVHCKPDVNAIEKAISDKLKCAHRGGFDGKCIKV